MQVTRPPLSAPNDDWKRWADDITKTVQALADRISPRNNNAYNITNLTVDRDYDADASSTAELADVLGTLINDLKATKLLK